MELDPLLSDPTCPGPEEMHDIFNLVTVVALVWSLSIIRQHLESTCGGLDGPSFLTDGKIVIMIPNNYFFLAVTCV